MNARLHEIVDNARMGEQTERYCVLVTLVSKLILALLFAGAFVAVRYWP